VTRTPEEEGPAQVFTLERNTVCLTSGHMHLIWRPGQNTDPIGPRATASVGLDGVDHVHLRAGGVAQVEEGLPSSLGP
jgi:hypothetical protein